MEARINELIEIAKGRISEFNNTVPPPLQGEMLEGFVNNYELRFGESPDQSHLTFLGKCDGLYFADYKLYSGADDSRTDYCMVLSGGQDWSNMSETWADYIFFGQSSMDLYAKKKGVQEFVVLARDSDDIVESFESYDELLLYILELMTQD